MYYIKYCVYSCLGGPRHKPFGFQEDLHGHNYVDCTQLFNVVIEIKLYSTLPRLIDSRLAEQQPVDRWARIREYDV